MKLSKIASIVLGGSLIIAATGCGWWDDDDNGGGVSKISGSTLASYRMNATVTAVGDTNETFTESNTSYKFSVKEPANFDHLEVSNGFNNETNTSIPYIAKAPKGYTDYVSPLTTLLVDASDTVRKKLEKELKDVLTIDYNKVTEYDLKKVKKALVVKLAVEKVLAAIKADKVPKALLNALEDVNLTDVNSSVAVTLVNAIAKETNVSLSDINATLKGIAEANSTDTIQKKYKDAEEAIVKSTAALGLNSITFGNVEAALISKNKFQDIKIKKDANITDFYKVAINFNKADVKYLPDNVAAKKEYNATFTIKIDQIDDGAENRWVELVFSNVKIVLDNNNTNSPISVKFENGKTKLGAYASEDLSELHNIVGDGVTADVKDLTNTDFEFDIQTILNNLSSNSNKINQAIDALNDYLSKRGAYEVSLTLDVNDTLKDKLVTTKVTGNVFVNSSDNNAPTISEMEVKAYIDENETKITQIDENKTFYVNIDANDTDGDPLTAYLYENGTLSQKSDCDNVNNGCEWLFEVTAPEVSKDTQYTYSVKVCDVYGACSDEYKKTVTVKNTNKNSAPELNLTATSLTVDVNETNSTTYTVSDPDGDDVNVTVASNDDNIATATAKNGTITVTGVREGNATITVTASDGELNDTKTISVEVKNVAANQLDGFKKIYDNGVIDDEVNVKVDNETLKIYAEQQVNTGYEVYVKNIKSDTDLTQGDNNLVIKINKNGASIVAGSEYDNAESGDAVWIVPTHVQTGASFGVKFNDGTVKTIDITEWKATN